MAVMLQHGFVSDMWGDDDMEVTPDHPYISLTVGMYVKVS